MSVIRISMRRAITVYAFLVRLYHYGDDVMRTAEASLLRVSGKSLEDLQRLYYLYLKEGFCCEKNEKKKKKARNATINVHCFAVHMLESRRRSGPLQQTSTEAFESLYGVLQRCYTAGTRNTPKQCFENHYMKLK